MLHGTPEQQREADERPGLRLSSLGSGSDFTPFLQHLGIASIHLGYGGENRGGSYHSLYDSFDHYVRFGDPEFDYGVTLARTAGRVVLRLASAELLPFDFRDFAERLGCYIEEITEKTDEMRKETERTNRLIAERVHQAVADPQQPFVAPEPLEPVPHLNFAPLQNAQELLLASATRYAESLARFDLGNDVLSAEQRRQLDRILFTAERFLTWEQGLPRRPWFRHQIYAPGFYTGYAVKTLPGVREAVEQREWGEAESQMRILAGILERYTARIDEASAILVAATSSAEGSSTDAAPAEP
jgi:N-acetylated-alpha-linked acidic dipeptidase